MRIDELQSYAEQNGFDSVKFKFTNLKGEDKTCKWLDAYMGIFKIDGNNGFMTVKQWKEFTGDIFEFEIIE
jgi:hypothetical protein